MPRRFAHFQTLLGLLLTLSGCATIAGRRQIIAVDSQPRGVDVYVDGEAKPAGKTPLFVEVKRARELDLRFRSGSYEKRHEETCGIRWKGFGISNAVMTIAMWPVGLTSTAIDLADGAAWECDSEILQPLPGLPRGATKECHRYLVVPPYHSDELISDRLALRWIQRQTPQLGACDRILSFEGGKTELEFLNFDNTSDLSPKSFDRALLNLVGFETGATDLVFLKPKAQDGKVEVTPSIEDLQRETVTNQPPLVFTGRQAQSLTETGSRKYLSYSINLLPNSIAYSFSHDDFVLDQKPNDARAISNVRNIDTFPTYLTGFSLSDVEHPHGIGAWGVTFHVSPFVMPEYWDLAYDLNAADGTKESARTKVFSVIAQYYAGITFHTPIGALSLSAGAGPMYYSERFGHRHVNDRVLLATSYDFTYTAFITDRVYFLASSWITEFPGQHPPLEDARFVSWTQTGVGLGYFLPSMRGRLRQMIASKLDDDDGTLAH